MEEILIICRSARGKFVDDGGRRGGVSTPPFTEEGLD
jgi:hypothetical protein